MSKNATCCFIGHREIEESEKMKLDLKNTIEDLICNKNITDFLFGSKSGFDTLCREIVTELKVKYPHIRRIYVRSMYSYIEDHYQKYLMTLYDDTYLPDSVEGAGRLSYVKRNCEMIDKSGICVFYYDKNRVFTKRKSGTKVAYDYAAKKKANIVLFPISE